MNPTYEEFTNLYCKIYCTSILTIVLNEIRYMFMLVKLKTTTQTHVADIIRLMCFFSV